MKIALLNLALAGLAAAVCSSAAAAAPAYISAAISSPDRPPADVARDAARKPEALIVFAGIKPGERVADIMPGQGYFTRIFSNLVGAKGRVFAIVPSELLQVAPKAADGVKALAADPAFANVTVLIQPTAEISAPAPLDVAWTSDNYHDLYGFFGADKAAAFDAAVFKALKPGGVFIVIDHVAKAGTSDVSPKTLHRIDPQTVKAQLVAAGFKFEGESPILRNEADTHDLKVFAPEIRGHTDQFVFKFRKPAP